LIFENGTVANLTASRVSNKTLRKIRIFQPDSYISVDCYRRNLTIIKLRKGADHDPHFPGLETVKREFPGSDPLQDEIRSFVDSINDGRSPEVTGQDGRKALKVALSIIEQIEANSKLFREFSRRT
jgi:predicted dehydrogenase